MSQNGDAEVVDSDDEFQYEEVALDSDEEALEIQEEENFESAMRHLQLKQLEQERSAVKTSQVDSAAGKPELVDDFIRNFMLKMNLSRSLDAFQNEWYEKIQSGEIKKDSVSAVPDVFSRNQELENRIQSMALELDKARDVAQKARSTWDKFRKERDFHRLNHMRVAQEKNVLVKDLRRLREHITKYEPTLEGLETRYQLAMKEKAMAKLQCDRLQSRVDTLETQVKQASRQLTSSNGATVTASRAGPPPSLSPTKTLAKTSESKASVLPPDDRPNPFLGVELGVTEAEKFGEKKSFPAHMSSIAAVCAHPSKPVVATASDDCTWKMWSVPNGDLIMTGDGHKDWIAGLDFHPRGSHLATASGDGTVKLWSFSKSKCVATYTEHSQAVWSCMFHDGGDFLVSGSMDHTCKLWDVSTGRCRMSLRGHVDSVNSVCFQPFSNNICSSSGDKTVSLWDSRSGLCIQTLYGHSNSCNNAAFNLRGDTIVSSDADGGVRIWDIRMVQQRLHIDAGPLPANKCLLAAPSAACCGSFRHTLQVLFRPQRHSLARRLRR